MTVVVVEERPRFGGGSERMSLALAAHFVRRGHVVTLVHAEPGAMVAAYRAAGVSCEQRPVAPVAARRPVTAWRSWVALAAVVQRERADVLFTSQVSFASLTAAVGRATRTMTAMHLGLVYDYPSPLFRAGMARIDLGVAPSEATAEGWRRRGWPPARLRVIPNGIDLTTFRPTDGRAAARARVGLADEGEWLVYAGRVVPEKGIFTLLRACASLRARGRAVRLVVAGSAEPDVDAALAALARELDLHPDAWQRRPATGDVADLYRAADVVVVPSEWDEPFGLVAVEAQACGTLVVASDRGALPRLVEAAGPDAVFAAGNAEVLADRLASWLDAPERRAAAASRAGAQVRRDYDIETCGDAYLAAFEGVRR